MERLGEEPAKASSLLYFSVTDTSEDTSSDTSDRHFRRNYSHKLFHYLVRGWDLGSHFLDKSDTSAGCGGSNREGGEKEDPADRLPFS